MTELSPHDAFAEAIRLSNLLDSGITALRTASKDVALAENAYRKARSEAWIRCPNDEAGVKAGEREWTAARREAWVDAETADLRYKRDVAADMRQSALEAVRSRRAQLSAIQTFANAEREEAAFARTGPHG
jgi:hypothetical protein